MEGVKFEDFSSQALVSHSLDPTQIQLLTLARLEMCQSSLGGQPAAGKISVTLEARSPAMFQQVMAIRAERGERGEVSGESA
eukprot:3611994-Amphidinium_carterae.1